MLFAACRERLLRLHLGHIDALDAAIAELDWELEAAIAPFRAAVEQVITTPVPGRWRREPSLPRSAPT
jgi:hypothetical protein